MAHGRVDRGLQRMGIVLPENPSNGHIGAAVFGALACLGAGLFLATYGKRSFGQGVTSACMIVSSLGYVWLTHRMWQNKRAHEAQGTEMEQVAKGVV